MVKFLFHVQTNLFCKLDSSSSYKECNLNKKVVIWLFSQSTALNMLTSLYVGRSYHLWKDPNLLPWLERNVHQVIARVDTSGESLKSQRFNYLFNLISLKTCFLNTPQFQIKQNKCGFFCIFVIDPLVAECLEKRKSRYIGAPRNIYRHVIMSDIKDATTTLPRVNYL